MTPILLTRGAFIIANLKINFENMFLIGIVLCSVTLFKCLILKHKNAINNLIKHVYNPKTN